MEPFYFLRIPLSTTPPRTIVPPRNDHGPRVSPRIINTNIGLSIGSIIGKIIASKAVTCFIAVVYNMYGIPS